MRAGMRLVESERDMLAGGWTRTHSWTLGQLPFPLVNSLHQCMAGKGKQEEPREPEWGGRSHVATRMCFSHSSGPALATVMSKHH